MLLLLAWWFTLYKHIRDLYELKKYDESLEIKNDTATWKNDGFYYTNEDSNDNLLPTQHELSLVDGLTSHQDGEISIKQITNKPLEKKKKEISHGKSIIEDSEISEKIVNNVDFSAPFLVDLDSTSTKEDHQSTSVSMPSIFNSEKGEVYDKSSDTKVLGFVRSSKRSAKETVEEIIISDQVVEQAIEPDTLFGTSEHDEYANDEEMMFHLQKNATVKLKNESVGRIHSIVLKDQTPQKLSKLKVSVKGPKQPAVVVSQHAPVSHVFYTTSSPTSHGRFQEVDEFSAAQFQESDLEHDEFASNADEEQKNDEVVRLLVNMKKQKLHEHASHIHTPYEDTLHEDRDHTNNHSNDAKNQKIEIEVHFGTENLSNNADGALILKEVKEVIDESSC